MCLPHPVVLCTEVLLAPRDCLGRLHRSGMDVAKALGMVLSGQVPLPQPTSTTGGGSSGGGPSTGSGSMPYSASLLPRSSSVHGGPERERQLAIATITQVLPGCPDVVAAQAVDAVGFDRVDAAVDWVLNAYPTGYDDVSAFAPQDGDYGDDDDDDDDDGGGGGAAGSYVTPKGKRRTGKKAKRSGKKSTPSHKRIRMPPLGVAAHRGTHAHRFLTVTVTQPLDPTTLPPWEREIVRWNFLGKLLHFLEGKIRSCNRTCLV